MDLRGAGQRCLAPLHSKKGVVMASDEVAVELLRIHDRDGILKPQIAIEEARDEESVLHEHFDWDDRAAAFSHRMSQARKLIRSVEIVVTEGDVQRETVQFVHQPEKDGEEESGYLLVTKVRKTGAISVMIEEVKRIRGNLDRSAKIADAFDSGNKLPEGVGKELWRLHVRTERLLHKLEGVL